MRTGDKPLPDRPEFTASHVTICVSDLARAEAFYAALGFERLYAMEPPEAFKQLLERPDAPALAMVAMQNAGLRIELLSCGAEPPAAAAPRIGPRHLSLRVNDLAAAAAHVVRAGGAAYLQTRMQSGGGEFLMAADPDGLRLLLMHTP